MSEMRAELEGGVPSRARGLPRAWESFNRLKLCGLST